MSDRRTIDFTAERNKRRGIEEQGADIGNVPDYMKISDRAENHKISLYFGRRY